MKNLGLKLLALFLACVVWFVVSAPRRETPIQRNMTASLSLVGMPSHLVITSEIQNSVGVRVRGRMSDLRALASQALEASADLNRARAGAIEITLLPQHINVPPDVEVVSISPNKIRLQIEELRQRAVPIRPFLVGDPPAGYLIGEAASDPTLALISGPESQVLKLSEVATERIIMTGRTATFVQNVAVVSDSPLVRVLSPITTQVTVPVLAEVGPEPPTTTDTSATTTTTTDAPPENTDSR
jgi:YbbR domain-containing protein